MPDRPAREKTVNPGSIQSTLAEAIRFARGDQHLAEDLETVGRSIAAVVQAGDALIESAAPHPTDANFYCVTVACFEQLSAALTRAGGVS